MYRKIDNCPKCHGGLFYYWDVYVSNRQRLIKCFSCGATFTEFKEVSGKKMPVLVKAITPLGDRVKNNRNRFIVQPGVKNDLSVWLRQLKQSRAFRRKVIF